MIPGDQPKIPVLFLFMEFAPVNTTGNFRGLKFIKYISQYNIQPIVVTFIEEEGAKYFNAKIDTKLLSDIPGDCILYRIHCSDRSKFIIQKLADFMTIYFSIKDSLAKRWKSDLFKGLVDIMEKHKPKMLVTSLPPFSSGKLAMQISKKFRIPYILDMRDLWAHFGHGPLPSYFHYKLTIREENIIFRNASAIIGVTPQLINIAPIGPCILWKWTPVVL